MTTTKNASALQAVFSQGLAFATFAAVILLAGGMAMAANDVKWSKRTVINLSVEIPDHWEIADDLAEGEAEFMESDDPQAPSFAVYRDIDLTELGDKSGQISSSSAIVGGQIGRRSDWRRGGRRGATIILSDRSAGGGQVAINFSAPQKDWNRIRPIFRHAVRSIRFGAARSETAAAKPAPADTQPDSNNTDRQAVTMAPAKPVESGPWAPKYKKVEGDGFELQIPANWNWARLESETQVSYGAIDEARQVAVRIGRLQRDENGLVDESFADMVDAARTQMTSDEMIESVDLDGEPNWQYRERYEGVLPNGNQTALTVLLNDRADPAVAMVVFAPKAPSADVAKVVDTITKGVKIDAAPGQQPAQEQPVATQQPETTTPEAESAEAPQYQQITEAEFTLRIPKNWKWARVESRDERSYVTGDVAENVALRVGILGSQDARSEADPYDTFVDAARNVLAYDELIESNELTDNPRWQYREHYEGTLPDGEPVDLIVLLNEQVEPAIALAMISPADLKEPLAEIIDTVEESLETTASPAPKVAAVTPETAPQEEKPEAEATQPAATAPETTPTETATAPEPGEQAPPATAEAAAAVEAPQAAAEAATTPQAPATAEKESPAQSLTEPTAVTEPDDNQAETPAPAANASTGQPETPENQNPAAAIVTPVTKPAAPEQPKPFDPAAASANRVAATPPIDQAPQAPQAPQAEATPQAPQAPQAEATPQAAPAPQAEAATETAPPAKPSEQPENQQTAALADAKSDVDAARPVEAAPEDIYVRAVPEHGLTLRVPDGWTIQETRQDGVDTWRLRNKAWREGVVPEGVFSATATVSLAEKPTDTDKLFKETVDMLSSQALTDGKIISEGTGNFAGKDIMRADISGALRASEGAPLNAIMRVLMSNENGKLIIITAFTSAIAPQALDAATGPNGLIAPMAKSNDGN